MLRYVLSGSFAGLSHGAIPNKLTLGPRAGSSASKLAHSPNNSTFERVAGSSDEFLAASSDESLGLTARAGARTQFFGPEGVNLGALEALGGMDHQAATILVVEDHRPTRMFLADNLTADGFEVLEAECAADARRLLERSFPDLAIVDLGLPDGDGLELLAHVREADRVAGRLDPELPLLVLSGRVSELDRLRGFSRGCDDYVVKPFSYFELSARIRALLRRTRRRPASGRIRIGSLELDPLSREVWLSGEPVALSKKEYALLRALAGDPTRVFTREELLRGVWGFRAMGTTLRERNLGVRLDSQRTPGSPGRQTLSSSLNEAVGQDK